MAQAFPKAILRRAAQAKLLDCIFQGLAKLREGERFGKIIEHAQPEGGAHVFKRREACDHNDAEIRPAR